MEQRRLGSSDLRVSALGLGTMTWGEDNTADEAFEQLDRAMAAGITLVDVAEMYPVPPRAETQGRTEEILGAWLARRGRPADLVIASKVTGPSRGFSWIREGSTRLTADDVVSACDGSLARLGVDHIDLYQVHWPARNVPLFGQRGFTPRDKEVVTPPEETLRGLQELVASGRVRYVGLSNETPWGVMAFLRAAEQADLPTVVSVQNAYNLLNRADEHGLTEVLHREGMGLLAYSPLAMGLLTGKYAHGARPAEGRLVRFSRFRRYTHARAFEAADRYVDVCREAGLDPAAAAIAWCAAQPTVASALFGATSLPQLETNLSAADLTLPDEVVAAFDAIHEAHPNPCP